MNAILEGFGDILENLNFNDNYRMAFYRKVLFTRLTMERGFVFRGAYLTKNMHMLPHEKVP